MTLATDFTDEYRADMARRSWPGRTLLDHLDDAVASRPDVLALVGYTHADDGRRTLTYAELAEQVDRVAAGLLDLGVQAGQVVSMQLPNWWQMPVLSLACLRVGAVTNALMPIFRSRELEFMLGLAESSVLVVPEEFAGFDHAAMARDLAARLPALTTVITVRPGGGGQFDAVLAGRTPSADDRAEFARRRPDPDAVVQLAYTSGTTGEPKGVMVTSNTALCNVRDFAARLGLTPDDVQLMASPLAHQTGYMYGFQMPILRGATSVLQDVWRPERATEIIRAEGVAFTMASTPFLSDLTRQAEARPEAFASFRVFLCAGAPVPRDLVRRATVAMDARIGSGWGMSEMGAVTATGPDDADERVFETDGSPLPDVELRVIGLDGDVLGPDVEGSLQVRANSLFGGYLKRPDLRGCDAEGWFDTGDLARIDADGFLRITGRSKDIIIRGGENIPVVEIENLLYSHPDVAEVAIVAMSDERLGERACAFVVPREGAQPTLEELGDFLAQRGAATQYRPERLELVDALPRTLTGKIQKFRLRERLATSAATVPAPREGGLVSGEVVTWTRDDRVVVVRLASPPVNALAAPVVAGLDAALDAFDSSDARVLVIVSDVPGFFVAGADLKAMADHDPDDFGRYLDALRRPVERIAAAGRPSIAAIDGQALGGGLELAMAATLRVAGRDARLGLPETRLGLIPGAGGTQRLPRLVGRGRALDLILTPRTVDAAEAHAIGLVDRLVDAAGAETAACAWAAQLAALPTATLAAAIRCVDDAHDLPLDRGLAGEADRVGELFAGEDAREGVAAFLARRTPDF